MNKQEKDITLS